MGRAPCCDKANVKRGPWSPEEDAKLKSYIDKNGTGNNWITLPQKIGLKRCGKSCRLRWLNYLRPNIKHGDFSEEEDNIICTLYLNIGSRWSIIAAQLPGRTDNDIKNYWNTKLKKKLLGKQRKEQQATRRANPVMMIKQEMKREDESFMNMMIMADPTNNFQYPFDHIPSNQHQPFDQNPNINPSHLPQSDDFINFQEFNNWTIDQLNELLNYNGTNSQSIDKYEDGVGSFSGVEMVNGSSSGTTLSTESTSWGTSTGHMSCFISSPPPPMIVAGDYEYSSQGFVQDSSSLIQDHHRYFGLQKQYHRVQYNN